MIYKFKYQNNSVELLFRLILWIIASIFIIPIPWVINDSISYFSKGFKMKEFENET